MELSHEEAFQQISNLIQEKVIDAATGSTVAEKVIIDWNMGTMFFRDEEGNAKIILIDYIKGWCFSFPGITKEQRDKLKKIGVRFTREYDAYFWDIRKPGRLNDYEIESLAKKCLTLITYLF